MRFIGATGHEKLLNWHVVAGLEALQQVPEVQSIIALLVLIRHLSSGFLINLNSLAIDRSATQ